MPDNPALAYAGPESRLAGHTDCAFTTARADDRARDGRAERRDLGGRGCRSRMRMTSGRSHGSTMTATRKQIEFCEYVDVTGTRVHRRVVKREIVGTVFPSRRSSICRARRPRCRRCSAHSAPLDFSPRSISEADRIGHVDGSKSPRRTPSGSPGNSPTSFRRRGCCEFAAKAVNAVGSDIRKKTRSIGPAIIGTTAAALQVQGPVRFAGLR